MCLKLHLTIRSASATVAPWRTGILAVARMAMSPTGERRYVLLDESYSMYSESPG